MRFNDIDINYEREVAGTLTRFITPAKPAKE